MEIVNLQKKHDRGNFSSKTPLLDDYIKKQASQDVRKDLSACYVMLDNKEVVTGYYTLSSNSIPQEGLPEDLLKKAKLPRSYKDLPAVLIGRLAVDVQHQGKRYGELLLMDALERCLTLSSQLGTLAIVVDPIDDKAISFYSKYGFIPLRDSEKMFIPMETVRQLYNSSDPE